MIIDKLAQVDAHQRTFALGSENAEENYLDLLKHQGWSEVSVSAAPTLVVIQLEPGNSLSDKIFALGHLPEFLTVIGEGRIISRWCTRAITEAAAHSYECTQLDPRHLFFELRSGEKDELSRSTTDSFMHGLDALVWRKPALEQAGASLQQSRQMRSLRKLAAIVRKKSVSVGVQKSADLSKNSSGLSVQQVDIENLWSEGPGSLPDCDILLLSSKEFVVRPELVNEIRAISEDDSDKRITCAYLRDNHHMYQRNLEIASAVDFVAVGHAYKDHYLRAENFNIFFPGAMGVNKFDQNLISEIWEQDKMLPRNDRLYGSYNLHINFKDRTDFIELCSSLDNSDVIQWWPGTEKENYNDLSEVERFKQWISYKVSLVVNTDFCVPIRVYVALLAGQIPIVPTSLVGMSEIFTHEMLRELPILTYGENTARAVQQAWADGIKRFDQGGAKAAEMRHRYAFENLFYEHTWERIFDCLLEFEGAEGKVTPQKGSS